ncbi:MAG: hypothetical protein Q9166_005880 [cf. Caloplaca sp. 2 TL-2023]
MPDVSGGYDWASKYDEEISGLQVRRLSTKTFSYPFLISNDHSDITKLHISAVIDHHEDKLWQLEIVLKERLEFVAVASVKMVGATEFLAEMDNFGGESLDLDICNGEDRR